MFFKELDIGWQASTALYFSDLVRSPFEAIQDAIQVGGALLARLKTVSLSMPWGLPRSEEPLKLGESGAWGWV